MEDVKIATPGQSQAEMALQSIQKDVFNKLEILFRTFHALTKHGWPFTDFVWQCELDAKKGLDVGTRWISHTKRALTNVVKSVPALLLTAETILQESTCDSSTAGTCKFIEDALRNLEFFHITRIRECMIMELSSSLKLSGGDNWTVWNFQMEVILRGRRLFEIVSGAEVEPVEGKNKNVWIQNDAMAQELILVCEKESAIRVHVLQPKFFLIEFKVDSVATFMCKQEEIMVKLKQAREPISDKMLIMKVLMSLPEWFNHFRSVLESVPLEMQSVQELTSRLLIEEE
ncbi:hypothetical protein PR048_005956 [Dryococelus australis]|uniref:Uncharacterized protein n=1 Tax=Dryococelus australis TaxID=614101 RepID=A0ABQ9IAT5_9NEOP|nr:hypothetical protein PR048_005956 [Dryococelus australis]